MSAAAARWIVPAAVTALVVGGGVAASASSDATPDLPERSAEELLVAVGEAEPTPYSGTVRTVAALGLPSLGDLAGGGPGSGGTDPASALTKLLTGENQLRVWVGGPEQQRVSLVDDFAELDVVRDGDVLWTYSSSEDTATRFDLAQAEARFRAEHADEIAELERELAEEPELPESPYAGLTPDELARTLLADADETTEVAVGDTQVVAGRDAYTLTATPRDPATLVGTVEVAVDAETGLVLQVQVGARDQAEPAFVTGFTSLDLSAPDPDVFAFTPAPGTTVVDGLEAAEQAKAEAEAEGMSQERPAPGDAEQPADPVVHGEGWSTVVELQLPADALEAAAAQPTDEQTTDGLDGGQPAMDPQQLLGALTTEVDGGRVLTSALVTVLLTDDGRVFVGAVDTATLLSYAG
jgi:outer membrane lipoprotein-sorting protein